jgi:hypothetical protein
MPPKGKRKKVRKTVFTTFTEVEVPVEVPLEMIQGRTGRKARLRRNRREWLFFVTT